MNKTDQKIKINKLNKRQLQAIISEYTDPEGKTRDDLLIQCNMLGIKHISQSDLNVLMDMNID